jgi:aspartokinase
LLLFRNYGSFLWRCNQGIELMSVTVLSFTPADLAGGDAIVAVADALAAELGVGKQVVALVSAMAGVADQLLDSIRQGNYRSVYTKLLASHTSAARRLARDEVARKVLIQDITDILDSYNWLGRSLVNRAPTPIEADNIATLGERLSARLLSANLQGRGIQAVTLNAVELIPAGSTSDVQTARVQSRLLPLLDQGYIVVVAASTGVNPLSHDLAELILSTRPS